MKGNRTENRFYFRGLCVCVPLVCFAEGESYDQQKYTTCREKCKRKVDITWKSRKSIIQKSLQRKSFWRGRTI